MTDRIKGFVVTLDHDIRDDETCAVSALSRDEWTLIIRSTFERVKLRHVLRKRHVFNLLAYFREWYEGEMHVSAVAEAARKVLRTRAWYDPSALDL